MMVLFLLILIVYGFMLVSQSWNRTFNTLKMSYAWCTLGRSDWFSFDDFYHYRKTDRGYSQTNWRMEE